MALLADIIQTVVQAIIVGGIAFCGILVGKKLRTRKNEKIAMETQEGRNAE